jgi:hypothetical protein
MRRPGAGAWCVGVGALALAALLASSAGVTPVSGAFFKDSGGSTASFVAGRLQPPTGLSATGGSSVHFAWTPTVSAAAAGYNVLRATTSGGAYTSVASVTPASATAATDTPASAGTYWYVLRAYDANWTSANSAEVSAAFAPATATGFRQCAWQAADTGGDGNGYEVSAASACAVDGVAASDVKSGSGSGTICTSANKDRHRFGTFGFGMPGSVTTVDGITAQLTARIDATGGTDLICAELSWDGGTTWTAAQSVLITSTTLAAYVIGGATTTWGHTWTAAQFSDANFRVRLTDVSNNPNRNFFLDGVQVQVNYTP